MSFIVNTPYPHGHFCWADLSSTDVERSERFYSELLGWQIEHQPTDGGFDYTTFLLQGEKVAGAGPYPPEQSNMPSSWNNYIAVKDLESIVEKAKKYGAKILFPPIKVMSEGHMASIEDPQGAVVGLWQPINHRGAGIVNTATAMSWQELLTEDPERSMDFYSSLFDWTYEESPAGSGYYMITNQKRLNGGISAKSAETKALPTGWSVYFTIKNAQETATKIKQLGGTLHGDIMAMGSGNIIRMSDPTGAENLLIAMNMEPEPWN